MGDAPARGTVVFLTTSSGVGGAERQVYEVAVALHDRGWQVRAISMLPVAEVFADLPSRGIPTFTLGMRRGRPSLVAWWRLARILRDERADILHSHMIHANLLARLVRVAHPSIRIVNTMHSQRQGGRWRRLSYRMTDRLSDRTTAVSQVVRDAAVQQRLAPSGRLEVVPNGVDEGPWLADPGSRDRVRRSVAPADEFLWLAVGRLTPAKDYPTLIEAFAQVLTRTKAPTRLAIAGTGPMTAAVEQLVAGSGAAASIDLLGPRRDVPELMQAADAFVMASAWEGLPMVLLEAGIQQPAVSSHRCRRQSRGRRQRHDGPDRPARRPRSARLGDACDAVASARGSPVDGPRGAEPRAWPVRPERRSGSLGTALS